MGLLKGRAFRHTNRSESKNGVAIMTAHAVKLKVIAGIPQDCSFWTEDDGWSGVCEELAVTVRGGSFEDAKTKMAAALQAHIEIILRAAHSTEGRQKVA
jgi:predicted RNase H-like HicB family nuclease